MAEYPYRRNGRRYYSLDSYLKTKYNEKMYKLSLNGGFTCPNRDGTCGTGGCIFCSRGGSGDFAGDSRLSIRRQIEFQKARLKSKYHGHSYIAYFQAFTNTYAPVEKLRAVFSEAIKDPEVRILSVATRPDCLPAETIALLSELNRIKPVWVELGLQTIHPSTAQFIRRGYDLAVFDRAVSLLRAEGIDVIVHTILYLPGETKSNMLETIDYLNRMDIQGVKLQLLHVLDGTDLGDLYREHPFPLPSMEEYLDFLGVCICSLRSDIVIHRLTGDGPKSILIAPLWTANKRLVLNRMAQSFKEKDVWQGKNCRFL
ncbi:TIGR01212 family radical SAM protein [Drancourtella sp. An210]|nr:TIGR01212 family radical SAM protein [Drancourtella sp. An210]